MGVGTDSQAINGGFVLILALFYHRPGLSASRPLRAQPVADTRLGEPSPWCFPKEHQVGVSALSGPQRSAMIHRTITPER